jgi:hypothetical protein
VVIVRYTKKYAKEILDLWKDKTGYFDGSMTAEQFQSMLGFRVGGFSQAEVITITMALIMAGAKFAELPNSLDY